MSKSVSELAADKLKIGLVNLTNQSVAAGASYTFLSHDYPGYLEECYVLSPTESFSLRVVLDGSDFFNQTYAQYKEMTQITKCIATFEERDEDGNPLGKYVVQIQGLVFEESIVLIVKNNTGGSVTFEHLFAKYRK